MDTKLPKRIEISDEVLQEVLKIFHAKLEKAFQKHGRGGCWSMHESLGMHEEEKKELVDEIHLNNVDGFLDESIDIMIAGFWGAASVVGGSITKNWD